MLDIRSKIFVSTAGFRYRFDGHRWIDTEVGHYSIPADEMGHPIAPDARLQRLKGRFEDPQPTPADVSENVIIKAEVVRVVPRHGQPYYVAMITKAFAPEYGGGTQVFTAPTGRANMHAALDDLRGMVTMSPGRRDQTCAGMVATNA